VVPCKHGLKVEEKASRLDGPRAQTLLHVVTEMYLNSTKNSVTTPLETKSLYFIKTNMLMLFLQIIDISCKNPQETHKYNVFKLHCCLVLQKMVPTFISWF